MGEIRVGKIYEFYFGKNCFVKYIVIEININFIHLRRIEDYYMGAQLDIFVNPKTILNKRKIRDWNEV